MIEQEILPDLQVRHARLTPVFVIGHGRSGTSVLIKLIRKYLKINFGTESQFIIRFYQNLKHYGDLSDKANAARLIKDIAAERYFKRIKKRFDFDFNPGAAIANYTGKNYADVLSTVFGQFAEYHGMERWGDKTPEYIYHLPVLHELYPDAQFLHIIRDGRDVALSEFETPFDAKNSFKAAEDWQKKTALVEAFFTRLKPGQHLTIRYEDLLSNPVDVFASLVSFFGIDDAGNQLIDFIAAHLPYDLKAGNFNKWKSKMSKGQQRRFEKMAGDQLRQFGYSTQFDELRPPTPFEKVFWEADNEMKKILMSRYWQDSLYRASLRIKSLFTPLQKSRPASRTTA